MRKILLAAACGLCLARMAEAQTKADTLHCDKDAADSLRSGKVTGRTKVDTLYYDRDWKGCEKPFAT